MKTAGFTGLSWFLALLFVLLAASRAQADLRDDALSAVLRCTGMGDRGQRLVCYDSAAVRVPGALNAPVAPVAAPITAPAMGAAAAPAPVAIAPAARKPGKPGFFSRILGLNGRRPPQTTVAQFGSESIANGGASAFPNAVDGDTINQVSARLTAYEFTNGYVTVTLDNGQEWRQSWNDTPVRNLAKPARSYVAVIRRGSGGDSYVMKLGNLAGTISVRRTR